MPEESKSSKAQRMPDRVKVMREAAIDKAMPKKKSEEGE